MEKPEIRRYTFAETRELLSSLVACYRQVFAEAPWSEWVVCPVCGRNWGVESAVQLSDNGFRHCNNELLPFWPSACVQADLEHEINLPGASCWIALDHAEVVGFCWGYITTPDDLGMKLGRSELAAKLQAQFGRDAIMAYQDEIGVVARWRRNGIARAMFNLRLADFVTQGASVCVARTQMNPPSVSFKWFQKDGYVIIDEYHDPGQRVVQAVRTSVLVNK